MRRFQRLHDEGNLATSIADRAATDRLEPAPNDASAVASEPLAELPTERLEAELCGIVDRRAQLHRRLLHLIAEYDRRDAWIGWGAVSCAHWLADYAGIEVSTARERVRVAYAFERLPLIDAAFAERRLSYSKVRAISRVATTDTQKELIELGEQYPAGELGRAPAARQRDRLDDSELALYQLDARTASWRTEPDGMVATNVPMMPEHAAVVCATVDAGVMSNHESHASADASSTWHNSAAMPLSVVGQFEVKLELTGAQDRLL